MTREYRFRPYEPGDADSINNLYFEITGNPRTPDQFEWQWLKAPGGRGEIWLIEAVDASGAVQLIGHHGIMPIRFTRGDEDLLFGKTENTMLLPAYRDRILYPRFEKRFAEHYEGRFDALFSTVGHPAAIRQRRAMRYEFPARWLTCRMPTSWTSEIAFARDILARRLGLRGAGREMRRPPPPAAVSRQVETRPLALTALDSADAAEHPFFDTFWTESRSRYGLTPSRDKADLNWRFWSNPYWQYTTLLCDGASGGPGYVILRRGATDPRTAIVEDIVPGAPTRARFGDLLDSTLAWLRHNGVSWAEFTTTDDGCAPGAVAEGLFRRQGALTRRIEKSRPPAERLMPRKVTALGTAKGISVRDWYVTPLVFEGR